MNITLKSNFSLRIFVKLMELEHQLSLHCKAQRVRRTRMWNLLEEPLSWLEIRTPRGLTLGIRLNKRNELASSISTPGISDFPRECINKLVVMYVATCIHNT